MKTIALGINGAAGRLGRRIIRLARDDARFALKAAIVRAGSAAEGQDVGLLTGGSALAVPAQSDHSGLFACDVVIDVSSTAASAALAKKMVVQNGGALVTGATGWTAAESATMTHAARHIAVLRSGNFSLGVTSLCQNLRETAARLGEDWGVHIHDEHHTAKKDAPSGTALMLSRAVCAGWRRQVEPQVLAVGAPLHTVPGRGEIIITALRVGDVVGTHNVSFFGPNEVLQFSHVAQDRDIFAHGALQAAHWLVDKPAGLYGMDDVLHLSG